jgi:hypothetical protein
MKERGARTYNATFEGETTKAYTATVPGDIDRTRVRFQQGDACNLSPELTQVGFRVWGVGLEGVYDPHARALPAG